MDHIGELADRLRSPSAPLRVVSGVVVAVPDASHVLVSVGDRVVTAWSPGSVPVGDNVRLLVGGNVCEVITASAPTPFNDSAVNNAGITLTTTLSNIVSASVTLSTTRRLTVHGQVQIVPAGSSAGILALLVDGVALAGMRRWHTQGTTRHAWPARLWLTDLLPPGLHTIALAGAIDPGASSVGTRIASIEIIG